MGHQSFISMEIQEDHWGFHPPNTRIRLFIYYLKRFSKKSTDNKIEVIFTMLGVISLISTTRQLLKSIDDFRFHSE